MDGTVVDSSGALDRTLDSGAAAEKLEALREMTQQATVS